MVPAFSRAFGALLLASASAGEPVRIAVLVPLTGDFAEFGKTEVAAARLAVDRANATGGVKGRPIELSIDDTGHDPARGLELFRKRADEGAKFVYAASSGVAVAIAPEVQSRGLLLLTDAASPKVSELSSLAVRHCPDAADESALLVADALARGHRRWGLLHMANAYGESYRDALSKAATGRGAELVAVGALPANDASCAEVVARVIAAKPEAILVITFGPPIVRALEELRTQGFRGLRYSAASIAYPNKGKVPEDLLQGVRFPDVWWGDPVRPEVEALRADLQRLGVAYPPRPLFTMTFDAFTLVLEATRDVGDDPRAVRKAVAETASRRGASGDYRVLHDGRIRFELEILELDHGRIVRASRP